MEQYRRTWETFIWPVCIINLGCELDRLRQLYFVHKANNEDDSWIKTKLYESFVGLIDSFQHLHKKTLKS